jgi:glycosyltransferase involved in cell wall biosynthesis
MSNTVLSIVLPVRDQPLALRLTLEWLTKVIGPKDEIIVVDDGSVKPVAPIVSEFEDRLVLSLITQVGGGRAAARNIGWRTARGRRVLFNDADRLPAEADFTVHRDGAGVVVGRHLEFYFSQPDRMAERLLNHFGELRGKAREPFYPKLVRQYLYNPIGESQTSIPWASFLTGNVSVERNALEQVNGFDEAFQSWGVEHFELGYRLWQSGQSFSFNAQSTNYHLAHPREAGFYQKHMRDSLAYFRHKHPDPTLAVFERFLFGEASLQDVERASGAPGCWVSMFPEPVMFRSLLSDMIARRE